MSKPVAEGAYECSLDENSPKAEELSECARYPVLLLEGPRVPPVTEADGVAARDSSGGDDDAEQNQPDDSNDLYYREPEPFVKIQRASAEVAR